MSQRHFIPGAIALLAAIIVGAAGAATSAPTHAQAVKCTTVAKGTPWHDSGRRGTMYTITGNRTTACAVGVKWLVHLTARAGDPTSPPGWSCIVPKPISGVCLGKAGAVFQWVTK